MPSVDSVFESVCVPLRERIKAETAAIEKEMADRHEAQFESLMRFGRALSEMNEKLFHSSIEQMFCAKSAEVVQRHIDKVTLSALERMQCPKENAQAAFERNRLSVCYGDRSEVTDDSATSTPTPEMVAIDAEIETLQRENADLEAQRDEAQKKIGAMMRRAQEIEEGLKKTQKKLTFREVPFELCLSLSALC